MRIAYFDCFSGISGDMILGALVDAGLQKETLTNLIHELGFSNCSIKIYRVMRRGISATKVDVIHPPAERKTPTETLSLVNNLNFPESIKTKIKKIFLSIARTEAKIHQEDIAHLHLHELGSPDTIIDIAGAVIGLHEMGIKKIYASSINVGTGMVRTAHGTFPVPAPATAELLREASVYSNQVEAELTTPTGAAILTGFDPVYGSIPSMRLGKVGYGAGQKDLSSPNLLRILIGECEASLHEEQVVILETNIDDMNPEFYDYVTESLFKGGALDVFLIPIQMKKSRPGILLGVLCEEQNKENLLRIIFSETTTLGVRVSKVDRRTLKREMRKIQTSLGKVRVKISLYNGKIVDGSPEHEDCKQIAIKQGLPLKKVYEIVKGEINSFIEKEEID